MHGSSFVPVPTDAPRARGARLRVAWIAAAIAVAGLCWSPSATAQTPEEPVAEDDDTPEDAEAPDGADIDFGDTGLSYWMWGTAADRPPFVGDGRRDDMLFQRLRTRLDLRLTDVSLDLEADWFTGQLAGDPRPEVPRRADTGTKARGRAFDARRALDLRELFLTAYTSVGQFRAGLQKNQFGLGIVANNGDREAMQLFDQKIGGDRAWRLLFATAPGRAFSDDPVARNIYVALGADLVYRDEFTSARDGDRAVQGLATVFYRRPDRFLGTYVAYRDQVDRNGDDLEVLALDVSGSRTWRTNQFTWSVGAEAAWLAGTTNRVLPQSGEDDELRIRALGVATESQVTYEPHDVHLRLLAGVASGDANNDDDTLYRFRFDPNYDVGLVLFEQYLPAVTRAGYARATDPERTGEPIRGIANFINDGAVENAYYLNPQLLVGRPDGLLLGVGVLWAIAQQPLTDPYETFAAGGAPTNVRGGPASRDLGIEVDVASQYRHTIVDGLDIELKLEYGILFPGEAFADMSGADPSPQNLIRGRFALIW